MSPDPGSISQHFDGISERYRQVPASWRSVYEKARSIIEPLIKDKKVLDVGNGGFFAYDTRLARSVIAMDISAKMLDVIREPGVLKQIGDARDLAGIADDSQEVIIYLMTLHHLNGPRLSRTFGVLGEVLAAAHRKLGPGGLLLIVEPVLPGPLYYPQVVFFGLMTGLLGRFGVPMVFFYRKSELRRRLARAFGLPDSQIEVFDLPIKGWVDPLGGTFPGKIRIPAALCPTRCHLFKVKKTTQSS